jgi:hypothetical protein
MQQPLQQVQRAAGRPVFLESGACSMGNVSLQWTRRLNASAKSGHIANSCLRTTTRAPRTARPASADRTAITGAACAACLTWSLATCTRCLKLACSCTTRVGTSTPNSGTWHGVHGILITNAWPAHAFDDGYGRSCRAMIRPAANSRARSPYAFRPPPQCHTERSCLLIRRSNAPPKFARNHRCLFSGVYELVLSAPGDQDQHLRRSTPSRRRNKKSRAGNRRFQPSISFPLVTCADVQRCAECRPPTA